MLESRSVFPSPLWRNAVVPAFALLWTAGGCIIEGSSTSARGDLTVSYTFDSMDCDQAGVAEIDIDIERGTSIVQTSTVTCSASPSRTTFFDLREGDYRVFIDAYGYDGALLYDTGSGGRAATVIARTTQSRSIDVPASLGDLTIYWTFLGTGNCGAVYEVRVTLEDPFSVIYDDALYPCDYGGVSYDQIIAGDWHATLRALDSYGSVLYTAFDRPVFVSAYAHEEFSLDLD